MFHENQNSFPPRRMTWKQAAWYAGECESTIRRLAKEGKITVSIRKAGAHPKVLKESLDRWIDSTKVNYREVVDNIVLSENLASVKASNGNNNP